MLNASSVHPKCIPTVLNTVCWCRLNHSGRILRAGGNGSHVGRWLAGSAVPHRDIVAKIHYPKGRTPAKMDGNNLGCCLRVLQRASGAHGQGHRMTPRVQVLMQMWIGSLSRSLYLCRRARLLPSLCASAHVHLYSCHSNRKSCHMFCWNVA